MIQKVTNATIYVKDQNEALRFYTECLGFEVRADQTLGDFRWLTVGLKGQPDFDLVLYALKANDFSLNADEIQVITRLVESGKLGGAVLRADDLQKTYEELKSKGVEFMKPPTIEPYGTEAVFKDNSGNIFSLQQTR